MASLRTIFVAILLATAPPAYADPVDIWRPHIAEASSRFGIPEGWIIRVMRAESGGKTMRNGHPITSHAGAMGLMQLMPGTWGLLRDIYGLGSDPHAPRDNIIAGTAYLRMMYDQFGYPGLFGAYNAGPGRYASYLRGKSRLPAETRAYMATIAGGHSVAPATSAAKTADNMQMAVAAVQPTLFVIAKNHANSPTQMPAPPARSALFIALNSAQRDAE